jgi:hypothetical protein
MAATAAPTPSASPVATPKPADSASAPVPATGTAKPAAVSGTAKVQAKALSGTAKPLSATASADHKSVALGTVLAFVPGIAFHGAGHVYAGSYMKGFGLMAIEGACVAVGYDTVRRAMDNANGMNGGGIPTDLSPFYTDAGIAVVTGLGFFWTWWDDIAGTGIAVNEYNKQQDEAANAIAVHAQLLPAPGGAMLALSTRF